MNNAILQGACGDIPIKAQQATVPRALRKMNMMDEGVQACSVVGSVGQSAGMDSFVALGLRASIEADRVDLVDLIGVYIDDTRLCTL